MKKLATLTLTAFTAFATPALAGDLAMKPAAELVADNPALSGRVVQAKVNGMVCDFCAQSLTKVLMKNDAVESVDISLETQFVTIILKDGGEITDEEVDKAIYWAGYENVGITRA